MSNKVGYRNNGITSEEGINRIDARAYSKEGVLRDGDLLVTQNGTPNNTVLISTGDIIIGNASPTSGVPDYYYHAWVTAADSVTITSNVSGNPRIDSIVAYINKSFTDGVNNDNPNGCVVFSAVPGTAAATPVVPTDATIQAAVGASNPWVLLAQVAVANGFSSISTANITDERPRAASVPRIMDIFQNFVNRGTVPSTSASLSTTLPLMEAFVMGYQISKPDIIHLFTASKDTYVDISQTATATTNDDYVYTAVANGAAAPSLAVNSIRLYKVITSGSAITLVTDLRNLGPVGPSNLSNTVNSGWISVPTAPNTVTYNGQRSYNLVFNSVDYTSILSPGQRLMTTRTVAAPTQCTSLNGTTQFWNMVAPNKLTFTNNFVVDAYVKMTSYTAGTIDIVSRYNNTSGWELRLLNTGQIDLIAYNAASTNNSLIRSYQSIPLNKWVRITAQLDMANFTATPTTSYVMIDGIDVPCSVLRNGTNPTSLIQAGNLEVGSMNGGTQPFPGKIAQVAIFNAKVTQAQMLTYHSQGYLGTETSLVSAYSFNGVATDLMTTTPNNLTAQASAGYTADSPFGTQASSLISSTLDYGIVQSAVFSTNTTVVVQVPEGCTIPTSGGVSVIAYSGLKAPYGFPSAVGKWDIITVDATSHSFNSSVTTICYIENGSINIQLPIGVFNISLDSEVGSFIANGSGSIWYSYITKTGLSDSSSAWSNTICEAINTSVSLGNTTGTTGIWSKINSTTTGLLVPSAKTYFLGLNATGSSGYTLKRNYDVASYATITIIKATNALL
jgi:hypothetical protein